MNANERMYTAMSGGKADRVPFMPQICFPHAVLQLENEYEAGIIKCIEDPSHKAQLMFEITKLYQSDGFRMLGGQNEHLKVSKANNEYIVTSVKTGERVGKLNLGTGTIEPDKPPINSIEDVKKINVLQPDEYFDSYEFDFYKEACKLAKDDFCKVGPISLGLSPFVSSRGVENAMFDLYDNKDLVKALLDKHLEIAINKAKALYKCGIDTIYSGDPWSSCSVVSPQIFEMYSFPVFKQFINEIKPLGMQIYVHICGNIGPIIDRISALGADCIEPMDPLGGISPAEFRSRVGNKTSLMGGVNTVTLSLGTAEDVKKEALSCIEGAGKDGGYILAAGDMVPFETPRENVFAMMEAAQGYKY